MNTLYTCSRCGVVTQHDGQVCSPKEVEARGDYCGTAPEPGQMCECMEQTLPYVCSSCGRPAEQAELVCRPRMLG